MPNFSSQCDMRGGRDDVTGSHDDVRENHDDVTGSHNDVGGSHDDVVEIPDDVPNSHDHHIGGSLDDAPDIDAIEADVADISQARLKLDDLLKEIADKNEECMSTDDETNKQPDILSNTATTSKKQQKTPRKKRRKDDYSIKQEAHKSSYIIKLFDREIDLAKFQSDTTLYAMLREWMKNRPRGSMREVGDTPLVNHVSDSSSSSSGQRGEDKSPDDDEEENPMEFIYELPKPTKAEDACLFPRPLPPALKTAKIEDIINTESNIEELRKDNMVRWRKVKSRWKEHSVRHQKRYMSSFVILKDMFTEQTSKLV